MSAEKEKSVSTKLRTLPFSQLQDAQRWLCGTWKGQYSGLLLAYRRDRYVQLTLGNGYKLISVIWSTLGFPYYLQLGGNRGSVYICRSFFFSVVRI